MPGGRRYLDRSRIQGGATILVALSFLVSSISSVETVGPQLRE